MTSSSTDDLLVEDGTGSEVHFRTEAIEIGKKKFKKIENRARKKKKKHEPKQVLFSSQIKSTFSPWKGKGGLLLKCELLLLLLLPRLT